MLAILLSASRWSWRSGCRLLEVIHLCEFCFDCFLDLVSGCLCEANGTHRVHDFLVFSNSGLVRRLDLFVFFGISLLFLWNERSEWSPLENFSVCLDSGYVRSLDSFKFFWTWFVVFCGASEASRAHSETFGFVRILRLFEVWVCSNFLDLVSCFCGVSEASGAHLGTFEFKINK